MIIIAIVFTILILIAFLRFGVMAEYSIDGLSLRASIGIFRINIYPKKPQRKRRKEKTRVKKEKKQKGKEKSKKREFKKPGSMEEFLEILEIAKNTLGRLRRRLLIKRLIIHYTAGSDDPAKTALTFGRISAIFSTILPLLKSIFRIRKHELRSFADFDAKKPRIYVSASISISVWETVYIFLALLPLLANKLRIGKKISLDSQ